MTARIAARIIVIAAVASAFALYSHRLGEVPAYLNLDEAHFGNHAYSLATTGRDLNGDRLPLFISLEDPLGDRPVLAWGTTWYHPIGFYLIATALTVIPPSEWSIRLPVAMVGVLNLVLIYLVARRWFDDWRAGALAAGLLALTPAHFILSRLALDYLMPVPFVLGWLLALVTLMARPGPRLAALSGAVLGLGCYSYVTSWLLMPAYLLITAIVIWHSLQRRDLVVPLCGGFLAPIAILPLWLLWHPSMPVNILAQYQAGESRQSILTAVASGGDVTAAMRTAIGAYWSYFNPSFLFVSGGPSRLVSTGAIGVWPIGMAVLLVLAIVNITRAAMSVRDAVVIAGLLLAPLPAALKGEPFAIQRAVTLLPFGALVAAGALRRGTPLTAIALVVAVVTIPWQFYGFTTDYFDGYRTRSAGVVDPTSFRDTSGVLIESAPPAIALTAPLYDISAKWRFYCVMRGRVDLLERTRYFSGNVDEVADMPPGSVAVIESGQAGVPAGWSVVSSPKDVAGATPLTILRRE